LVTKINTLVILSTIAATLLMPIVATTGVTTVFAQQNNLFNAQLAELYPHNVFNASRIIHNNTCGVLFSNYLLDVCMINDTVAIKFVS